mmetsp:Transcript_85008/g.168720  ORF Transcript_85008/g.168720 Transcript_85008/m.168720 type:complete len:113 (-) Transcript_85008:213-551(-)
MGYHCAEILTGPNDTSDVVAAARLLRVKKNSNGVHNPMHGTTLEDAKSASWSMASTMYATPQAVVVTRNSQEKRRVPCSLSHCWNCVNAAQVERAITNRLNTGFDEDGDISQ